ncbi:MAG: serine hydrolase domain-containing protein [Candidatus Hodarchaeota archaeon]
MHSSITNKNKKIEYFIDSHISSNVPGIQYIIMDSHQIIFEYAKGWADIKNQKPLKSSTTMMAYSMTKTFTAAAILQLIENKDLDLDGKIERYLSDIPYSKTITIRHLLSQTSGIPNPIPLRWVHLAEKHEKFDENAALAKVLKKHSKLSFEPGKKYAYSNISYWLLGKIIEKVSRQIYPTYMKEHILKLLGLVKNEISASIPNPTNHCKGYLGKYSFMNLFKRFLVDKDIIGEYEGKWLHIKNHYLNGPAFGGLIGSARGFSKFLQDQLKEESALFNKETKNLFYSQQKNNEGKLVEMTLGWHIGDSERTKYFFKEGGGGGYHCEMRIYPDQEIASIIMVNKTNFNSKKYLNILDKNFYR